MNSLLKWFFAATAALSALLLVATIFVWARSETFLEGYLFSHYNTNTGADRACMLIANNGRFNLSYQSQNLPKAISMSAWMSQHIGPLYFNPGGGAYATRDSTHLFSFASSTQNNPALNARYDLTLRIWPIAILLAILPLLWIRWYLHQTPTPGFCANCGYDLRATPGRCPECGAVPSNADQLPLPPH